MKHELEQVTWGVIPIYCYRGVLVEKIIGGYRVLGSKVITPKEVDEVINNAEKHLLDSMYVK